MENLHQDLSRAVEDSMRNNLKANCTSYHQVGNIPRKCFNPTAVRHRPKPSQSDHNKEWWWTLVLKWSIHQPPPLHGWHQAACQQARHWLTDLPHCSSDTGMSFGLDKCAQMASKKNKIMTTDSVKLPEGNISDVQNSSHKQMATTRRLLERSAKAKYLKRVINCFFGNLNWLIFRGSNVFGHRIS